MENGKVRGISFRIPNGYTGVISRIIQSIEIDKYFWAISEDQVFNTSICQNSGYFFESDRYTGNDFQKKIMNQNYYIVFANIQAYPSDDDLIEIKTYDDFKSSHCQIIIMISDGIFVDVYAKDKNIIDTIKGNAQYSDFTEISYITDRNDSRIEFRAI